VSANVIRGVGILPVRVERAGKMGSYVVTGETPLVYTFGTATATTDDRATGTAKMPGATGARVSREHDAVKIAHAASVATARKFILMSRRMEGGVQGRKPTSGEGAGTARNLRPKTA
jgi:hypothetical protein